MVTPLSFPLMRLLQYQPLKTQSLKGKRSRLLSWNRTLRNLGLKRRSSQGTFFYFTLLFNLAGNEDNEEEEEEETLPHLKTKRNEMDEKASLLWYKFFEEGSPLITDLPTKIDSLVSLLFLYSFLTPLQIKKGTLPICFFHFSGGSAWSFPEEAPLKEVCTSFLSFFLTYFRGL